MIRFRIPTAALGAALCLLVGPLATAQPDRSAPPPPLAEVPVDFPEFQELRLSNGLPMIVVEHDGQPVVNLNLYVRAGEAADPAELAGRASLVAELLTKGTSTRSAEEIAETIEGVGGRLNAWSGNDWLSISTSVLVEHTPLAFELMRDVALEPTFPEDELEITRRRVLSALRAQLGQPGAIAQRHFLQTVYGDHPYGVSAVPGTVEAVSREDLVAFHQAFFAPANALLVVSGAISAGEALAMAEEHFGGWRARARPAAEMVPVAPRDEPHIYLVHRPGSVQSTIWVGHPGMTPGDPDFFNIQVLNRILGQGADARLFRILREERGWTYGAYSRFTRPRDVGYFAATTEVRTEVTDSALVEIMHQLRRLRTEEIPEEEFQAAVDFLAGSFPLRIETPGQIASQVAEAHLLGLSADDVTEYRERIRAVTPEGVRQAALRHVHPDHVAIVVVGDANVIYDVLAPIAPISLYDVEGEAITRDDLAPRAADETFDASRLEAHTATYQLTVQGQPFGTVVNELGREDGVWVASSRIESAIIQQESESRFGVTDFAPIASSTRMQQGPMTVETDLTVEDGRIVGRANMPEQMGGSREVDVEMVDGTVFHGVETYVLAVADLEAGRTITLPVYDATGGAIVTATFEVVGREEVTVPAGTFDAFVVEVSGPQAMTLHLRTDAPHVMLRQEMAAMPIVLELQSIE